MQEQRALGINKLCGLLHQEDIKVVEVSALPDGEHHHVDFCPEARLSRTYFYTCKRVVSAVGKGGYVALVSITRDEAKVSHIEEYDADATFMRCIAVQGTTPITRLRALDHIYPLDL